MHCSDLADYRGYLRATNSRRFDGIRVVVRIIEHHPQINDWKLPGRGFPQDDVVEGIQCKVAGAPL
jgi:hypothetical protein